MDNIDNTQCIGCDYVYDPNNLKIMTGNLNNQNRYLWLYASNYGGLQWCYDKESNQKIESIYNDYLWIMNNNGNHNHDNIKMDVSPGRKKKIIKTTDDKFDEFVMDNDNLDLMVEFPKNEKKYELPKSKEPLSYIVKMGSFSYKMDFDLMKQINIHDTSKRRSIKRITIPDNVGDIMEYIKGKNVIGISGKKF